LKYFLLFILFLVQLHGTPIIHIDDDATNIKDFNLEYFVDKTEVMPLEIVRTQHFTQDTSTLSLGTFQDITWLRFQLHNSSNTKQKLFIHNELAYLADNLHFYTFSNNKLTQSYSINIDDTNSTKKIFGTDAIFEIQLDINQTKTIYIKSTMNTMQFPLLSIYSEHNSKKRVSQNNLLLSVLLGMLIALSIYHAFLYFTTRHQEYIYYAFYLAFASIWESIISGTLANSFGIYMNNTNEVFLSSIIFLPIFLILFAKSIFDTKINYKLENKFLDSVIFFFIIDLGISIFNIYLALIIVSSLYIYMFIVLFITTYSIMKKGNPFALTFLLANTIFSLFMMLTNLYYQGLLNYTPFIFNAASIGVILEALVLSWILSYKIKLLQKSELQKNKEILRQIETSREKDKMIFQQQKLVSMGEMIENIAHQWRQPLAKINASVLVIDEQLKPKSENYKTIDKHLSDIEEITQYMSKTIENFRNFFDPHKEESHFSLHELIASSLIITKNSHKNDKIKITFQAKNKNKYFGLKDELQEVLIILINNAKDVLLQRDIDEPNILIKTFEHRNKYVISICDNAGGVDEEIIDKIFEPYFTTKHKSQGTGLGLYISKIIIEENMLGTLSISNTEKGACFKIELPNINSCPI